MKLNNGVNKGFTLVEMLLVMVIIAIIIVMSTSYMTQKSENLRIDKTALQMQYLLNAGLAYYVAMGKWPDENDKYFSLDSDSASALQPDYLPASAIVNQYGGDPYYIVSHWTTTKNDIPPNTFQVAVYVGTTTRLQAIGNIIAGKLPFGHYDSSTGYVYAYVNIPGQNLNNAAAVNFAGLYHHGGCVPVPVCPDTTAGGGTTMAPQIFVVPVSVSGVNDEDSENIYPISSFTAFATPMGATPPACPGGTANACQPINGNEPESGQYWRVCMQVVTERGDVQETRTDAWGDNVTLSAFTRCAISNEPSGSTFGVFTH